MIAGKPDTDDDDHRSRPAPLVRPKSWPREHDAWRWNQRVSERYVNALLRIRSGTALPPSLRARILAMGLPEDIVKSTLQEIHQSSRWSLEWIETAQRFLGDYRRQVSASQRRDAAQARMLAGMCYHIAQLLPGPDQRTLDHCRGAASTLAGQALAELVPHARKLDIPWRNHQLPSILIPGPDRPEPSGLVVVFNGASTIKEELLRWLTPLARTGMALLLVDNPGTGESHHLGPPQADDDDLLDGMFDMLRDHPAIDPSRVGVMGIGIGGNVALRCLARDRRIAAGAAVTAPYDPGRWFAKASPLLKQEMGTLFGHQSASQTERAVALFSLQDIVPQINRPTLIVGAGRDLVVPPSESTRLVSALGAESTLAWYPGAAHSLYEELPAWTTDVANWFDAVLSHQDTQASDVSDRAELWRASLERKAVAEQEWDESAESARIIAADEILRDDSAVTGYRAGVDDEYSRAFDDDFAPIDRDSRTTQPDDHRST
jgi:alpha-beta hydrolase superfamily lysophospholipase